MTKTKSASARKMLSARTGARPKLLQRKALEKAEAESPPEGDPLEDSFPADSTDTAAIEQPEPMTIDATSLAWSAQDEATFQALSARRKASGFKGRGKYVSAQLVRVGDIAPNPGTVVATIVALVAERGTVARGELIAVMATTTFSNAKARPSDSGWCQGYVAGALRSGFLADASEPVVAEAAA